jgi:hypothetical protein
MQTVLAACWFFVPGACIHLFISGELAPEERVRVAEIGLATALITFLQRSVIPLLERASETRRGGVAWAAATETLQKYIVTMFDFIVELSRFTHPIRGSVLGAMPAEYLFFWRGACAARTRGRRLLRTVSSGRFSAPCTGVVSACQLGWTADASAS